RHACAGLHAPCPARRADWLNCSQAYQKRFRRDGAARPAPLQATDRSRAHRAIASHRRAWIHESECSMKAAAVHEKNGITASTVDKESSSCLQMRFRFFRDFWLIGRMLDF